MPRDLHQVLERTAAQPTGPVDAARIVRRARRQRLARRVTASAVGCLAVAAVVAGGVALWPAVSDTTIWFDADPQDTAPAPDQADLPDGSPDDEDAGAGWSDTGSFAQDSGVTLLFDDGYDGVLAVDPGERVAARRPLDGQRAGDPRHRLHRTGDALVVAWDGVHAVGIDAGESERLDEGTVFVPAVEPGQVWLIEYADGRVGAPAVVRRVDVGGGAQVEVDDVELDGSPAVGVPGGLALETSQGVAIWDADAGQVVRRLGATAASGFVADADDRSLVWCQADCASLQITDVEGDGVSIDAPSDQSNFAARNARLSPDGGLVAAIAGDSVVVIDVDTGAVAAVAESLAPRPDYLAWSQDGSQLFFSARSYGKLSTNVGRYQVGEGAVELATLPLGGALSFVVLDRDEADAFLSDVLGDPEDCRPPHARHTDRTDTCGYNY